MTEIRHRLGVAHSEQRATLANSGTIIDIDRMRFWQTEAPHALGCTLHIALDCSSMTCQRLTNHEGISVVATRSGDDNDEALTHAHRCTDSLRDGQQHSVQRLLSTASPHAVIFGPNS